MSSNWKEKHIGSVLCDLELIYGNFRIVIQMPEHLTKQVTVYEDDKFRQRYFTDDKIDVLKHHLEFEYLPKIKG